MWGKTEQGFLWIISYLPVLVVALYRYFFEEKVKTLEVFGHTISDDFLHLIFISFIMLFSAGLYYYVPKTMFKKLNKQMVKGEKGRNVIVKKFERPNLNDYTFFLLTLILPLITVDFTSTVSFLICFSVIIFIIILLTRVDYIIACPLFFVSTYKVWKIELLETSEQNEEYTINAFVITNESDFFDKEFRVEKLIRNIYYLTEAR
ncbi:hypothetical protein [Bacillus sp. NTK034]|uniref:hypothetical protein n=1 Tax=Bacillaceae TaxID=186817 RepID=UPI001A8C81EE|nr:hypothetical protein [Bacillus sp. NTK034]MBN8199306.1 hypothetical protein [Bacillus sp. NTK034]